MATQAVKWHDFFQAISDYLASTGLFGEGSTFWAIDPDSDIQWPASPPPFGLVIPRDIPRHGDDEGGGRFSKVWVANIDIHIVVGNIYDVSYQDTSVVTSPDLSVGPYAIVGSLIDLMEQAYIKTAEGDFATIEFPVAGPIHSLHRFAKANQYVSIPVSFSMTVLQKLPSTIISSGTPN